MSLAPIVLFVYNRPEHTRETLNALAANSLSGESDLYIYADGPKADASAELIAQVNETRKVIHEKRWCRQVSIVESKFNRGLANSVINGVTEVINKHGRVIVLEDDLVTHPFFLTYLNYYLMVYENEEKVISVHGYVYPVKKKIPGPFFLRGADCWGWATWKRGWDLFEPDSKKLLDQIMEGNQVREFNFKNAYDYRSLLEAQVSGQIDSWAIRWYTAAFLLNKLTLYPPVSLVYNIGHDGSGTHKDTIDQTGRDRFNFERFDLKFIAPVEDRSAKKQVEIYLKGSNFFWRQIKQKIRSLYRK
ncbi:MAG TPA: glycosyltransferase family 2 protein [Mucilaginibacter sp.]|jgi:GT2 family glycosyltransferase|nr:glycosyltransferase family 2 protein [Mucilaginibacter sp.]